MLSPPPKLALRKGRRCSSAGIALVLLCALLATILIAAVFDLLHSGRRALSSYEGDTRMESAKPLHQTLSTAMTTTQPRQTIGSNAASSVSEHNARFSGHQYDALLNKSMPPSGRMDALLRAVIQANQRRWKDLPPASHLIDSELEAVQGDALKAALSHIALKEHWRAREGDGIFVRDASVLRRRVEEARKRYNRQCLRPDVAVIGQAAAKLEGRFLQEWITYHLWLGYEHMLVFINHDDEKQAQHKSEADDDDDGTMEALRPFVDAGFVTAKIVPGARMQTLTIDQAIDLLHTKLCRLGDEILGPITALPDCPRAAGGAWPQPPANGRTIWLAAQDVDEYMVLTSNGGATSLEDAGRSAPLDDGSGTSSGMMCIADLLRNFSGHGGLAVNWQLFGANGHETEPRGRLVTEAYTGRHPWGGGVHPHVKTIANVQHALTSCGSPHCFRYRDGKFAVDESGWQIQPPGHFNEVKSTRWIALHHYDSKSITNLAFKWLRGRAVTGEKYGDEDAASRAAAYVQMERGASLVRYASATAALPFLRFVLTGEG